MDRKLFMAVGLAAAVAFSAEPAAAQVGDGGHHVGHHRGFVESTPRHFDCDRGERQRHHRGDRLGCGALDGGFAYADGEWGLYNNRSWEPDSYNDWWNDRPDRAYPRWVQEQQARGTCDPDRMWWSGSGWHC